MPAFDKRIGDFEAANTQVLGISTDSPFSHENWAKAVGISHYPLLSDLHRSVVRDYGVYSADWNANSRATFVIDQSRHHPLHRAVRERRASRSRPDSRGSQEARLNAHGPGRAAPALAPVTGSARWSITSSSSAW